MRHPSKRFVEPTPDEIPRLLEHARFAAGQFYEDWLETGAVPYGVSCGGIVGGAGWFEHDTRGVAWWRGSDDDDSAEHVAFEEWVARASEDFASAEGLMPEQTWATLTWAAARRLTLAERGPKQLEFTL